MESQKIVFISFNQALHGLVIKALSRLNLKGYTNGRKFKGRGLTRVIPIWAPTHGLLSMGLSW